jgi:hypothetical protein
MIYKSGTKDFVKNFQRAGKNWRGSRGGKFLSASREQPSPLRFSKKQVDCIKKEYEV